MPTIQDWFQVYVGWRDAAVAAKDRLAEIKNELSELRASQLGPEGAVFAALVAIQHAVEAIKVSGGAGVAPDIAPLVDALKRLDFQPGGFFDTGLSSLIEKLGRLDFQPGGFFDTGLTNFGERLARLDFQPGGFFDTGLSSLIQAIRDSKAAPFAPEKDVSSKLDIVLGELVKEGSPIGIARVLELVFLLSGLVSVGVPIAKGLAKEGRVDFLGPEIANKISGWADALGGVFDPLSFGFEALATGAINDFIGKLRGSGLADPQKAPEAAVVALKAAFGYGKKAHVLAMGAERLSVLKHLGLSQAAAMFSDLAGFSGISSAVSGSLVAGSITRPMRFWANQVFQPEIPSPGDLAGFVRLREIDLPTYAAFLQMWGFRQADIDTFTRSVFREPSIRDLVLLTEDAAADDAWVHRRVQRTGFSDEDATVIAGTVRKRALRSARGRVVGSAIGAFSEGLLSESDLRGILGGLDLKPDEIELEVQAAGIKARTDYAADAIATYRKQFLNDQISVSDFSVALSALGLEGQRVSLLVAAAQAERLPRVAREEKAELRAAASEARSILLPRYRALFEMGLIDAGTYQSALLMVGISPAVASQAVALDVARRDAVARRSGKIAVDRAFVQFAQDREALLIDQFRRKLISSSQLSVGLAGLAISPERVEAIVGREQVLALPAPDRPILHPEEAAERLGRELSVQEALLTFRKGFIEASELELRLIDSGLPVPEAKARVRLEEIRKSPSLEEIRKAQSGL